jgi:hypothetical protein
LPLNWVMSDVDIAVSLERTAAPHQKKILIEDLQVVLIREQEVLESQRFISGCQSCSPDATLPFDYLLDELIGRDPSSTVYLMCRLAICPACNNPVTEKTLVTVS